MKTSVSQKTASKIGLIGSISLIIATVLGVGVFFKNGSVFANNNNNAIGVLLSWILAIVIALFTAFSFAEIVTVKGLRNPNAGLAGWSEKMVGYNFGRHVSLTQSTFYYPAKFVAMATFAAVAIFQVYFTAIGTDSSYFKFHAGMLGVDDKYTTLIVMGVAIALIAIFMTANLLSSKFGGVVSKGATFVKFVPILMIILIGIIVGALVGGGLWNDKPLDQVTRVTSVVNAEVGPLEVGGIFRSIPAILFAFDSFLVIGNVQKNVENPEKNVPLSIIISMIIAAIFQMLITIGCITMGTGNPFYLLKAALDTDGYAHCHWAYVLCVVILSVSIVIATLGVINSYSMAGTRATQALVDDKVVFGHKWASKLSAKTPNLGGFVIYTIFICLIFFAVAIPSCILNTSHIYDGFSTLAVLFYFAIYGTTVLGGLINRKTAKNSVHKVGYFIPFGIIAVIGCYFAFGYCVFYQFSTQVAMNPAGTDANSFGFAMVTGASLVNWQAACVFWSAAIFFLGYPFVNDLLIKLTDKNYAQPLLWQKAKRSVSIKSARK
ncbi:MAG: amino acid permease [Mycoplasma sp.]|nr:amino acid permease [Candidatus Hennigella equi]